MALQAGDLRKRIALLQPVDTVNSSGGSTRTYQIIPGCNSVPAKIKYPPPSRKGDEVYTQQQVRSSVIATITMRYRPSLNINASLRIQFGTRIFEIRTVLPIDELEHEV